MPTQIQIVNDFVACFAAGQYSRLRPLLCEQLRFRGPWLEADSREAWLEALGADAPPAEEVTITGVFEAENRVAIFYTLTRNGKSASLAQLNHFSRGCISEIHLVFNPADFE